MDEPRYGWVVVWGAFFSLAVIFGISYSFAAFFESFARGSRRSVLTSRSPSASAA